MKRKEALAYAQRLCSQQEKCKKDIEDKLSSLECSREDIVVVITELEAEGYIDEMRYASAYSKDKFRFNKWGKIKISWQLRQKNLSQTLIRHALDTLPQDEYKKVLSEILQQKIKSLKAGNRYEKRNKLLQFAAQRGFEFELINQVLDELLD